MLNLPPQTAIGQRRAARGEDGEGVGLLLRLLAQEGCKRGVDGLPVGHQLFFTSGNSALGFAVAVSAKLALHNSLGQPPVLMLSTMQLLLRVESTVPGVDSPEACHRP